MPQGILNLLLHQSGPKRDRAFLHSLAASLVSWPATPFEDLCQSHRLWLGQGSESWEITGQL